MKAHQSSAPSATGNAFSVAEKAEHLIVQLLKAGPRNASEILAAAEGARVSARSVQRAANELGVVRRFYANEPPKHTKYETEFYDLLQESKRLRGTLRELDDLGYRNYADTKEQSPLAGEAKPLEKAAKNLGSINNEMQAVKRDDALNPTEKREKLDQLTVERNALLKAAVTESKVTKKRGRKAGSANVLTFGADGKGVFRREL